MAKPTLLSEKRPKIANMDFNNPSFAPPCVYNVQVGDRVNRHPIMGDPQEGELSLIIRLRALMASGATIPITVRQDFRLFRRGGFPPETVLQATITPVNPRRGRILAVIPSSISITVNRGQVQDINVTFSELMTGQANRWRTARPEDDGYEILSDDDDDTSSSDSDSDYVPSLFDPDEDPSSVADVEMVQEMGQQQAELANQRRLMEEAFNVDDSNQEEEHEVITIEEEL